MRLFSNKFLLIWMSGLAAASAIWLLSLFYDRPFFRLNTLVFDQYQRIKPRSWSNSPVVVIDVDDASLKQFGQWPWPRTQLAQITDKLGKLGVATIVFDMVFSEPDRTSPVRAIDRLKQAGVRIDLPDGGKLLDNDAIFAEAIGRNTVVTGMAFAEDGPDTPPPPKAGHAFNGTPPEGLLTDERRATRNLEIFDNAASGIGDFSFPASDDIDTTVRRAKPLTGGNGYLYPSLSTEALRVAQGARAFTVKTTDGSGEAAVGALALVSVQVGDFVIPTSKDGSFIIYHSYSGEKPTIPISQILSPQQFGKTNADLADQLSGRIAIIGTSAAGLLDLRATPLEPVVAGVTIHAEIIDQIISGSWLTRPDYTRGLELFLAIVTVVIVLALLPFLSAPVAGLLALIVGSGVVMLGWVSFAFYSTLISPILPLVSLAVAYATGSAAKLLVTEKHGRYVRQAFDRYLSPTMVELLASNPDSLKLGGEEKELTVLFCDIRGFTSLSEGLDPTELTNLLNRFLTPMTTVLLDEGATIDKYMGDAIMAFWNAPLDQQDHQMRACRGLLAMRAELKKLNSRSAKPLEIGIGVNTGPCCVGNLGSSQRFSYSAIGDSVNVSSRIEGMTKLYGVDNLISEETLRGATDLDVIEIDKIGVVGREQPLTVYSLLDLDEDKDPETLERQLDSHALMLSAYRRGDTETALVAMNEAQKYAGAHYNKLYSLYAERLSLMREEGIPDNWDGVYRATSK